MTHLLNDNFPKDILAAKSTNKQNDLKHNKGLVCLIPCYSASNGTRGKLWVNGVLVLVYDDTQGM